MGGGFDGLALDQAEDQSEQHEAGVEQHGDSWGLERMMRIEGLKAGDVGMGRWYGKRADCMCLAIDFALHGRRTGLVWWLGPNRLYVLRRLLVMPRGAGTM